jgi:hypothetical protein
MRAAGSFNLLDDQPAQERVAALDRAFRRIGWELTDEAGLLPIGIIDVATGGRVALDDQLARLRRSTDDPALLLGTAKDLLERPSRSTYSRSSAFLIATVLASASCGTSPANVSLSTQRISLRRAQADRRCVALFRALGRSPNQ